MLAVERSQLLAEQFPIILARRRRVQVLEQEEIFAGQQWLWNAWPVRDNQGCQPFGLTGEHVRRRLGVGLQEKRLPGGGDQPLPVVDAAAGDRDRRDDRPTSLGCQPLKDLDREAHDRPGSAARALSSCCTERSTMS